MLSAILAAYPAYLIYGARHCRQQQASIRFLSTSSSSYIEHTHTVRFTLKNTIILCYHCLPAVLPACPVRLSRPPIPPLPLGFFSGTFLISRNPIAPRLYPVLAIHTLYHRYTCPPSRHPLSCMPPLPPLPGPPLPLYLCITYIPMILSVRWSRLVP